MANETCSECGGKRRVRSGAMVMHREALLPPMAAVLKAVGTLPSQPKPKPKPVLLVHPDVYEQVAEQLNAPSESLAPRDRVVAALIRSGEIELEVSEHVPLWIPCRACSG